MLGISVYPYKEDIEKTIDYIKVASNLGYKRIFLNLLVFDDTDIDKFLNDNKKVMKCAKENNMEVYVDVNPNVFRILNIDYNNIEIFKEMGVDGIRLDDVFNGDTEAELTYNEYNLKIEVNASQNTKYIENILSKKANKKNLLSCHNFYPQKYSGLSLDFFIKTSKISKENGLRLAAFITSQSADHGPHKLDDKLPTLEMHRYMDIETQLKHFIALDLLDDIIISNTYASYEELKNIARLYKPYVTFKLENVSDLSDIEKSILNERHTNRGDIGDYLIRSSVGRVKYKNKNIVPRKNEIKISKGTVYIANNNFAQYKGELVIAKNDIDIDLNKINIIGQIKTDELFLLDYINEYTRFKFEI